MGAPDSNCISSGWSIAVGIVTFGLGILFNRFSNDRLAARKEDRELIDTITKLIADIETKAFKYFSLPANDSNAIAIAAEIRSLNRQIGGQVQRFSVSYPSNVREHAINLRQAVSLNGFDDKTRLAFKSTNPIHADISNKCRVLIGDLNMQFDKRYRK